MKQFKQNQNSAINILHPVESGALYLDFGWTGCFGVPKVF